MSPALPTARDRADRLSWPEFGWFAFNLIGLPGLVVIAALRWAGVW